MNMDLLGLLWVYLEGTYSKNDPSWEFDNWSSFVPYQTFETSVALQVVHVTVMELGLAKKNDRTLIQFLSLQLWFQHYPQMPSEHALDGHFHMLLHDQSLRYQIFCLRLTHYWCKTIGTVFHILQRSYKLNVFGKTVNCLLLNLFIYLILAVSIKLALDTDLSLKGC